MNPITFRPSERDVRIIKTIIASSSRPGLKIDQSKALRIALSTWLDQNGIGNNILHDMARHALDSWNFQQLANPEEARALITGLNYILEHDFRDADINEHVVSIEDWDGLQELAILCGDH